MLFLKGYQWPFDSKKMMHGSSVIDLLVYRERVLKSVPYIWTIAKIRSACLS